MQSLCRFKPVSGLNNEIPGFSNMPFFRMRLPDTHSKNHLTIQFCMRKKSPACIIYLIHQLHVKLISCFMTKTKQGLTEDLSPVQSLMSP
jgi:hypothetical protein